MRSKVASYLSITTASLYRITALGINRSGGWFSTVSSCSTLSSSTILGMSQRSFPSPTTTGANSLVMDDGDNKLFRFTDPSIPLGLYSKNSIDVLLQQRPFVIVEGSIVRDDILRSLQSSDASRGGGDQEEAVGLPSSDTFTSKHFLMSFPSGAYTTSRTVASQKVLRLQQHLSRMAESARLMITAQMQSDDGQSETNDPQAEAISKPTESSLSRFPYVTEGTTVSNADLVDGTADTIIQTLVRESLASGIASFEHLHPASLTLEKRITTLLFWEQQQQPSTNANNTPPPPPPPSKPTDHHLQNLRVLSYIELLPPPPSGPIIAQICRSQRSNALAKDSQWVTDRNILEQQKLPTIPPVHEMVLTTQSPPASTTTSSSTTTTNTITITSGQTGVLEGLSSNFFVVGNDGVVYTASKDEGVLLGTLRSVVLRVCAENGIPVEEKAPLLPGDNGNNDDGGDVWGWVGAFVSSTTRLALPVTDLIVPSSFMNLDADDNQVDILNFSYVGMEGYHRSDTEGLRQKNLGLVPEETNTDGVGYTNNFYKVGKCIPLEDSKGIMKIIVEGVHAAVLSESERPW